jgi:xyloglucan-specific exo-beta-1,4-glucanase
MTLSSSSQSCTWRNVKIVGGGFVTGIITHPGEKGLMYARTDVGGAYRWDATAQRWIPLLDWVSMDDSNLMGIESIALDPHDVNCVYLAAGTYTKSWAGNGCILRSRDRGRSWQRTNMPFKMGGNEEGRFAGERLVVDPADSRRLYFGSRDNGLWRSSNGGEKWEKVESFPFSDSGNGVGIVFIVPGPVCYVGVSNPDIHLYKTVDGGVKWEPVKAQPKGMLPNHGVLDEDGTLYITYGNAPGPNGMTDGAVWKLDTKSGKWFDVTPLKPKNGDTFGYAGLTLDRQKPGTLMVSTLDRWAKRDEIFRSTDHGKTWTPISPKGVWDSSASPYLAGNRANSGIGHWIGDIEIDPYDSNRVYYVTGATVMGCFNVTAADANMPTHWSVMAEGIEETVVLDLISPPTGAHLISAVGDISGFRHDDLEASPPKGTMINPAFGNTNSLDFAASSSTVIVRVGSANKTDRHGAITTDGGKTWVPFESEPNIADGPGTIAISADGKTIVWSPSKIAPHYSADNGRTWVECKGLAAGVQVVSDRAKPDTFYAASRDGLLHTSTDGGHSFTALPNKLPRQRAFLRAVPDNAGHLTLAAPDGSTSPQTAVQHSQSCPVSPARIALALARPPRAANILPSI